jgi:basic membrane protein A
MRPNASAAALEALPRNVAGTDFRTEEAGYLAGYLAGLVERRRPGRDVVGWIGGEPVPGVNRWAAGYAAGARRAAPGITVLHAYTRDFMDPPKCRAATLLQISRGAGVVFAIAGRCGSGTLDAARTRGVWAIGLDNDVAAVGPRVLAHGVTNVEAGLVSSLRQLRAGSFETGSDHSYGLREGGVGLAGINAKVAPEVVERVNAVRREIVSGRIRVPHVDPAIRPGR